MTLNIAALILLAGAVHSASATVSPATVSGLLNLANLVGEPQIARPTTFGTHRLSGPGESAITIGGDAAGTPFIQYAATTPDTTGSTPYVTGTLNYSWELVSADGSKAPVLVHISTAGWVDARYGFGPYRSGLNLVPNSIDVAATAGGFNGSMQHTNHRVGGRSVSDETAATDLLLVQSEGVDVGTLEARSYAASHRAAVRPASLLDSADHC
jgi:hypothetical protein